MREFAAAGRPEVRARTPCPPDPRSKGAYGMGERFYAAHDYEALLLTPALTGLRLGEFLVEVGPHGDAIPPLIPFKVLHDVAKPEQVCDETRTLHEGRLPSHTPSTCPTPSVTSAQ